ncbi:MAG: choice-of-anchor A family protein [Saccharothrix sp.]|nr:choice-of-anchor A family protein [Saccharothrix sp.]
MQISRIGAAGMALAVAVAVAAIGWASGDGGRLTATVNPLRPVAPDDVYADPSHGFLVLVEGDARLYENETEGAVAVGGDVVFRVYNTGLNYPGTYVLPGDALPTSMVMGGRPVFEESGTGTLNTLNQSFVKIGDLSGASVLPSGGVTYVVPAGGDESTRPAVVVQSPQPADSVGGPSGFDFPALFSLYRQINADMAACPSTIQLMDGSGTAPWNGTDPAATIGLQPGQNILNITPEQLDTLDFINPAPDSLQPGPDAFLIINVVGGGDMTFSPPTVSWQGNDPSRHVLWNFTTSGTVTIPSTANTVWGTVYAPNADVVDQSVENIEGAVVARTLVQGGPVAGEPGNNGGEIHNAPFEDYFTTCVVPTTTTTEETTTTTEETTTTTEETTTTVETTTTTEQPTTTTTADSVVETTRHPEAVRPDVADDLADTGAQVRGTLVVAGLLVLSGSLALVLTRRRDRRG